LPAHGSHYPNNDSGFLVPTIENPSSLPFGGGYYPDQLLAQGGCSGFFMLTNDANLP